MEDKIKIRRATPEDARLISTLSAITFFDTFTGTCTDDDMQGFINDYFNVGLVTSELKNADDYYFIAFINAEAVGYIRIKEDQSDVEIINSHNAIELKRIYVLKEYYSQKVGGALMNFALDFALPKKIIP